MSVMFIGVDEYLELRTEVKELRAGNNVLTSHAYQLTEKNQELEAEKRILRVENRRVAERNESLRFGGVYRDQIVRQDMEIQGLKKTIRELLDEKSVSLERIEGLVETAQTLRTKVGTLEAENDQLLIFDVNKRRFQGLKIERRDKKIKELEADNRNLRALNSVLMDKNLHAADKIRKLESHPIYYVDTEVKRVEGLEETIRVMRIMNASQEETIKGFQKGRDNLIQIIEGA